MNQFSPRSLRARYAWLAIFVLFQGLGCQKDTQPSASEHTSSGASAESAATEILPTTGATTDSSSETGSDSEAATTEGTTMCEDLLWTPIPTYEEIAAQCEGIVDEITCNATGSEAAQCQWESVLLFEKCNVESCGSAAEVGFCIAVMQTPETGCSVECDGYWRRTDAGLHVLGKGFCFELPAGWRDCDGIVRPECECVCK